MKLLILKKIYIKIVYYNIKNISMKTYKINNFINKNNILFGFLLYKNIVNCSIIILFYYYKIICVWLEVTKIELNSK